MIPLWPAGAPGGRRQGVGRRPHAHDLPPRPGQGHGAACVICPGGGYGALAMDHEREAGCRWLNSLGITASCSSIGSARDITIPRCSRTPVGRSGPSAPGEEWGLDPHRVAILGFSAGGHLALSAGTHFDAGKPDSTDPIERVSSRPDRMILVYPVIALATEYAHGGSRETCSAKPPADCSRASRTRPRSEGDAADVPGPHQADTGVGRRTPPLHAGPPEEQGAGRAAPLREGPATGSASAPAGPGHIPPEPSFQAWPGLCAPG